jgi:hypothetical protein
MVYKKKGKLIMDIKEKILRAAHELMNLTGYCEDDNFVETVVNAIYNNDVEPLWVLEDRLSMEEDEEEDY